MACEKQGTLGSVISNGNDTGNKYLFALWNMIVAFSCDTRLWSKKTITHFVLNFDAIIY